MPERLNRWLAILKKIPRERRGFHYSGFPTQLGNDSDPALLPWPVMLVLEERGTESALLYRVDADGGLAGDTWHQGLEAAKAQAEFEYPGCLGPWEPIPDDVQGDDVVPYVVKLAGGRKLRLVRPPG